MELQNEHRKHSTVLLCLKGLLTLVGFLNGMIFSFLLGTQKEEYKKWPTRTGPYNDSE